MKQCPACGYSRYFVKRFLQGNAFKKYNFDGSKVNNERMYDHLWGKENMEDVAYCSNCGMALFKEERKDN